MTDEIEERLEYFQELEYATRMLNHPGDGLVLQEDFLFMVERVDVCIEYLESHVSRSRSAARNARALKEFPLKARFQRVSALFDALPALPHSSYDTH